MLESIQAARKAADPVQSLANQPAVEQVLRFFARERRWIDEQHLTVCRIPATTFMEAQRAAWMAAQFTSLGWDAAVDRAGNVTAQLPDSARNRPVVAITAHLDTVLAPRNPEEIRIDGKGRFLGPGIADNGAGLSGLLALARAIATGPRWEHTAHLLLVANVGEEGDGNLSGMKFLCRQSPFAGRLHSILVLDGPDMSHITADALACRRFEITVTGPGGHSWSDRGTANPIHALARTICWYIDAREEAPAAARSSWNFGVIDGGSTVNAIPASARVKVDLRSESPSGLDELANQLSATLERALLAENERAVNGRVSGKIRDSGSRPGGRLAEDAPILGHVLAVDRHLGIRSRRDCASTDANVPLSMGIPAVSIGAGGNGGGAHTMNEWYSPEGRDLGLRRAFLIACRLLEDAAAG